MTYQSEFLHIMHERGFIHQLTDETGLDERLQKEHLTAYIGFDCTAASLHVGSLMQIMVLRWLQKTGHRPIILLGGGTSKVGDPSGKDEARKLLASDEIEKNMEGIAEIFGRYLRLGNGDNDAMIVNNAEWLDKLNYIDFLRDYGRFFSVNRMLTQDSVRLRLEREQNLSFLEFNYMILQAYDFVELSQRYGCALQIGGSDQWGNIVMGLDLARRIDSENRFQPLDLGKGGKLAMKVLEIQPMIQSKRNDPSDFSGESFLRHLNQNSSKQLFGMTTPLLTTASGGKMGKTASGAVWLSKEMLTPYEFWQYWRNTEDADVGRFLRLFTELPMDEVARLQSLKGAEINEAKKILANEVTRLCHGAAAAKQAAETAKKIFEEGGVGESIPSYCLPVDELGKGLAAYDLFRKAGLAESGGDARRLIRGGGARINDQRVDDENMVVGPAAFNEQGELKLSSGKKKHILVKLG